ncbi:sulfatase [Pontiellaceae bacterium B12227]|nr:sulfatase [Pontiellaceae bacterium B12227]
MKKTTMMTAVLIAAMASGIQAATEKPNIVLIYMDDLGWKDIGCAGSTFYKTPNIDRLAAQGIRFTRSYSAAPLCAPSRGAVLTGKYPARTKYTSISGGGKDDSLWTQSKALGVGNTCIEAKDRHVVPSTETIFAEQLREAGYKTCFLGKWHCGSRPGYAPQDRGYDEVHAFFPNRDGGLYPHYLTQGDIDQMVGLPNAKPGDYLSEIMTDQACDFMAEQAKADKPFLLHLCHYLVHGPMVPKKGLSEQYAERLETVQTDQDNCDYAAMVETMDDSVGQIMERLEKLGLLENTLVIFTADNGGLTWKEVTSNYPLMGGKSFAYEGAYRVPFIANWKGRIEPGQINDTRVIGTDLYPTLLQTANLPPNPKQHVDGLSLMGEFTKGKEGPCLPERPLYFHHPHYTHASSPHSVIIDGGYKLLRYYNDEEGGYALFNLEEDPYEQNDLCDTNPETVQQLAKKLDAFLDGVDAERPIRADSEEGRRTLELHAQGANKGWSKKYKDKKNVINKRTERELAMKERAVQEQKIALGKEK